MVGINNGGGEQTTFIPGPVAGDVHVVVINNPSAGYLQWYLNGHIANSNAVTALLTGIRGTNNTSNLIGQHVDGTGGMIGSIDEFRIYNGELDAFSIAAHNINGPDTTSTNIGTCTNITASVPLNPIDQFGVEQITVIGQFDSGVSIHLESATQTTYSGFAGTIEPFDQRGPKFLDSRSPMRAVARANTSAPFAQASGNL